MRKPRQGPGQVAIFLSVAVAAVAREAWVAAFLAFAVALAVRSSPYKQFCFAAGLAASAAK